MFEKQLFTGDRVRLAAPDAERDVEVEAQWTLDLDYLHAINARPAYPLNPHLMKKQYEAQQKQAEKKDLFWWVVRLQEDDRLIGWLKLERLIWSHSTATLALAIGAPADRNHGFGSDVMRLALDYAFNELNLHRIGAFVPGYNAGALRFFGRFGFVEEARRREALQLHGRRYEEVWLGLLRSDYHPLPLSESRRVGEAERPPGSRGEGILPLPLGEGRGEGDA